MTENKMEQVESLLKWLASGEKDEDGNWLDDDDTQLVCDALEYYLNIHGQKNKMEAVAQLFSKKLNEDFKAVIWDSIMECRFTNEGLEVKLDNGLYRNNGNWLSCLLTGEAKIVEADNG